MVRLKEVLIVILLLISPVSAITDVHHEVSDSEVTLTYRGMPPFYINIRPDENIGSGGYVWARTFSSSFAIDLDFAINPSGRFYYMIRDANGISGIHSFSLIQNSTMCQKEFNVVFVLLENNQFPSNPEDIWKVNFIKDRFTDRFSWATQGLASVKVYDQIPIINLKDITKSSDIVLRDVTREFYKNNPDNFDFIFFFNTFDDSGPSYHSGITNELSGIGMGTYDNSLDYGSNHVLKSITYLKSIRVYSQEDVRGDIELLLNRVLHEMGHKWCCFVTYINESGDRSDDFRNLMNMAHWSKKLSMGGSIMGGYNWIDNGDGTFTANNPVKEGFRDIELYLMGLKSPDSIGALKLIISETPPEAINNGTTISGTIKRININQVIEAEGVHSCFGK